MREHTAPTLRAPTTAPTASAAPPRPSTRAVSVAPAVAPPDGAPIGTAAPTRILDVSPDARWVVIAQTRADTDGDGRVEFQLEETDGEPAGDATVPYLVSGSGEGEALDRYFGRDPSGRYVAYASRGRLWLRDTVGGIAWDLGPAMPVSPCEVHGPREAYAVAQFAREGHRLLYAHDNGARRDLIVRDLDTGREHPIDPGEGTLRRVELDAWGELVTLWVEPRSTTACTASTPPRAEMRIAPVEGGPARHVEGLVSLFGRRVVVRVPSGALVVRDLDGREELWVPASCDARMMHADARRDVIVVECEAPSTHPWLHDVRVYQHGVERLSVPVEAGNVPGDPRDPQPVCVRSLPWRVVYLDASGYLVLDLESLRVTRLDGDETWHLHSHGPRIITGPRRDGRRQYRVRDLVTGETWTWRPSTRYRSTFDRLWWLSIEGPLAGTVEGSVIDLERLRVTPTPRFTVVASGSGRVLRAAGGAYDIARGPLRWEALRWTEPPLARDPSPR